jgi:DNA-binding NarL/FixJ family response regulator
MKASLPSELSILIVDDHAVVREGLARILASTGEGWRVGEASSGFQALEWLRREHADLAIVDLSMPGMSGLELIRRIRDEFGRLPVLVLSMHAEEQYAIRAFRAGANGYITKDGASTELIRAVRKVIGGGAYVTPELAERVVLQLHGGVGEARHSHLSDRELEVLRRLVAGQRPTDIANALHLSVKTISTHKSRIQEKLDLPTLADLVRYGLEHGLVDGDSPAPEFRPPAAEPAAGSR